MPLIDDGDNRYQTISSTFSSALYIDDQDIRFMLKPWDI